MKSINDDVEYSESLSLINELSAKKDEVVKQINEIQLYRTSSSNEPPSDDVSYALQIEPGIEGSPRVNLDERYQTLVNQEQTLQKAISTQYVKHEQIRRTAGYRVFASKSDKYIKLSSQLLETVDLLIALNEQLVAEQRVLHNLGATDLPEVRFPAFGMSEQLPRWRDDLEEQVHGLKHTNRVHKNVK